MTRQHIVFLTGAGISVESGLSTFRGKDGMWNNKNWHYYASVEGLYHELTLSGTSTWQMTSVEVK